MGDIIHSLPAAASLKHSFPRASITWAVDLADGAGATNLGRAFPLPSGSPEGRLPGEPFVLASPLAGWTSKQWPLDYYEQLAGLLRARLGLQLVLNGVPGSTPAVAGTW